MKHLLVIIYGASSYVLFLIVFAYAIGFVGDLVVPRSVDNAPTAPLAFSLSVDASLLLLFGVQHSVMARPAFKRWWTRCVPRPVERSTYVLVANLVLALMFWQWRSIPARVWDVTWTPARFVIWALFVLGWLIVLASTFMINHFELFGLRQVLTARRTQPTADARFQVTLFYRVVRHPLMLGFIVAFWAAPTMTTGHLLFAAATTGYILIALQLEERDLMAELGAPYAEYRKAVPMVIPGLRPRGRSASQRATKSLP